MRFCSFVILLLLLFIQTSCNEVYKAGNAKSLLELQIETNLNQDFIFKIFDTSSTLLKYKLPKKLNGLLLTGGGDIEYFPNNNKIIYFSDTPNEAYHISSNGVFELQQVYNPNINSNNWIFDRSSLTNSDLCRIENRIQVFLIEALKVGRNQGLADTLLFIGKNNRSVKCRILDK